MYLHGAAGMHAHEYNAHPDPPERFNSAPILRALTRASYTAPPPVRRASTYTPAATPLLATTSVRSSAPARPISLDLRATDGRTFVAAPADTSPTLNTPASIPTRTAQSGVRFKEPETEVMSEDERSLAGSVTSRGSTSKPQRRRRSAPKTSTTYHIAHPAPTLTQKQRLLQIRPRILLQFQLGQPGGRPQPALDVVPSTLVVPRLRKRFPRMFRGNAQLGTNDVMILRSEDYDSQALPLGDPDSDEEGVARRDLLAVICQMRRDEGRQQGRAEIVLDDGTVWTATPLSNGLHEFVTVDAHGQQQVARWVRRPVRKPTTDASASPVEMKFTFSIIDPTSRRHPVMATMVQNRLEIPDTYTSVSPSSGRYPPTTPLRIPGMAEESAKEDGTAFERTIHPIDATLKSLIQITGVWVALRQGWSPYFKYNDTSPPCSGATIARGRLRSMSLTRDSGRCGPSGGTRSSTPESNGGTGATKDKIRRACTVKTPSASPAPSCRFERGSVPKRSASTGAAFMQRVTARKASIPAASTVSSGDEMMTRRWSKAGFVETTTSNLSTPTSEIMSPLGTTTTTMMYPATPPPPPADPPAPSRRRIVSSYIPRPHLRSKSTVEASTAVPAMTVLPSVEVSAEEPGYLSRFRPARLRNLVGLFRRGGAQPV